MRVLVCGGRNFCSLVGKPSQEWRDKYERDWLVLNTVMDKFCREHDLLYHDEYQMVDSSKLHIISGAAKGADTAIIDWCVVNWLPCTEYLADWKRYGKRAGPIRNQQMLDEGKPDLVIAFPGGTGTADMIRRSKAAGLQVIEV